MIRVLIADGHVLARAGLAALLRAQPGFQVVAETATVDETLAAAAAHHPDVALVDMALPRTSGIGAARSVLAGVTPPPRMVILAETDRDEQVRAALRLGVSGLLLKDIAVERLLAAVVIIAAGYCAFAPSISHRLVNAYSPVRHDGVRTDMNRLTSRERQVLTLVAAGWCNRDIADDLLVTETTVKTHLSRLMAKLGVATRAQAVIAAYESGFVVPGMRRPLPANS